MNIGEKIKRLRVKMNLTQEELANRCELSKGFISQVERDLTSPSIATLADILESLGSNLREFFSESADEKIVFQKDDVFVQENGPRGSSIHWIIPNAQKNSMEPIMLKLAEGGRSELYAPHEGELFGFVLSGGVSLCVGGRKFKAGSGEAFYYKANSEHYIENRAKGESVIIWVCSPPNF
ncbi:MAG: XRE family transcriptional regulator [Clostridiales bacterium]|jgi:transcriptional regulator with XRE-family HTH domain|nr:XRE family transcriptional regulator [Clostridiales bacterium]